MPQMSQRAKVILAMGILYVVWGTTYLAIKVGLDADLPPGALRRRAPDPGGRDHVRHRVLARLRRFASPPATCASPASPASC